MKPYCGICFKTLPDIQPYNVGDIPSPDICYDCKIKMVKQVLEEERRKDEIAKRSRNLPKRG